MNTMSFCTGCQTNTMHQETNHVSGKGRVKTVECRVCHRKDTKTYDEHGKLVDSQAKAAQ